MKEFASHYSEMWFFFFFFYRLIRNSLFSNLKMWPSWITQIRKKYIYFMLALASLSFPVYVWPRAGLSSWTHRADSRAERPHWGQWTRWRERNISLQLTTVWVKSRTSWKTISTCFVCSCAFYNHSVATANSELLQTC